MAGMTRYDKRWEENFNRYKEFVNINKRLPKLNELYNDWNIYGWETNQRAAVKKGTLSEVRKQQLDAFCPVWNGTTKEREQFDKDLMINKSDWKSHVKPGNHPIDILTDNDDELYICLSKGIYDVETFFDEGIPFYVSYDRKYKVLSRMFSDIEAGYLKILCLCGGEDPFFRGASQTYEFVNRFDFSPENNFTEKFDLFIKNVLDDKLLEIIKLRYGLGGIKAMSIDEIVKHKGSSSKEHIRQMERRALRVLRNSRLIKHMEEGKEITICDNPIIELNLPIREFYALKRSEINTIDQLQSILDSGEKIRDLGEKGRMICREHLEEWRSKH